MSFCLLLMFYDPVLLAMPGRTACSVLSRYAAGSLVCICGLCLDSGVTLSFPDTPAAKLYGGSVVATKVLLHGHHCSFGCYCM